MCRYIFYFCLSYRDFRESTGPYYSHTAVYWNVVAARLAFIIVFEHVIFFIVYLLQWLVPDPPLDGGEPPVVADHLQSIQPCIIVILSHLVHTL